MDQASARLLYHLVDWDGTQADTQALEMADARVAEGALSRPVPGGWRLSPTPESKVYSVCLDHWRRTGQRIPYAHLVHVITSANLPDGVPVLAAAAAARGCHSNGSDVPGLLEEIEREYKECRLRELLMAAASDNNTMRSDPDAVRETLLSGLQGDSFSRGSQVGEIITANDVSVIQKRIDEYHSGQRAAKRTADILTGFRRMDEHLGGFRPGQVLLLVGQSKLGKSVFSASLCMGMMLSGEDAGIQTDVLIANREMQNEWQQDRIEARLMWRHASMAGRSPQFEISPRRLTDRVSRGALTNAEKRAYYETLAEFSQMKSRLRLASPRAYASLDDLEGIISSLKRMGNLRVVYVDALNSQQLGGYTKFVESNWQALVSLMERLEQIALRHEVLVVAEVQERKEVATKRHPDPSEILAEARHMLDKASHVLRIWRVPGDNVLAEAQLLASRFAVGNWSSPLNFLPGDMYVEEADPSVTQRIDTLCATGRAR